MFLRVLMLNKNNIKKMMGNIPPSIGLIFSVIPFRYRLGSAYNLYLNKVKESITQEEIFRDVYQLVKEAEQTVDFYSSFYQKKGFSYKQLESFKDLSSIPVVTKKDLQFFDFKKRIVKLESGVVTNTGGTSGQPLKLLLDKDAHAREWAHMHTIWDKLEYKTSCIKLTLRGMNLGNKALNYNFVHNEFQVNAYCDFTLVVEALNKVLEKYKIEYLHGYPSGIFEFIKQLSNHYPDTLIKLKKNLKGIFYGSEYPAPIYRDFVDNELNIPSVSWYGHTEMAVLAYEKEQPYIYHPFQSYGFTESVEIDGKQHLVGTTIHNKVGPLIRYDTGDIIEPLTYKDGLLESFKVSEGRTGEFVIDRLGRNISLTALIFGRHHDIFSVADFIQVEQNTPGYLTVYVTSTTQNLDSESLFDCAGIDMEINFKIVNKPFKTKAGKVPLIVKGSH